MVYYYTVTNFFNPLALANHILSLQTFALLATLTFASVQFFFTYRIWGSYFILVANDGDAQGTDGRHPVAATINGLCAAGDIVIAIIMWRLLYSKRTGFSQSDGVIKKLIIYTVQNGAITSAAALITLIIALAVPGITYTCFYHITSKLYMNTMLSALNARNWLSGLHTPSVSVMTRSGGQNLNPTAKNESDERGTHDEIGNRTESTNPLASGQETETSARDSVTQTDLMAEKKSSDTTPSLSASPDHVV
ncbi:hypothetical protein D9619_012566 [Psilocybe cf. subviscida]|uniref:DUF6534 domain-containing protein n=1 Tax=Psilocybe cf. subviscida TaxID=2480587 RepID=A0A8H5B727_9AGAR|nr:hypothetical protein D9619_012566 [Psilocybe cf. subviscida]